MNGTANAKLAPVMAAVEAERAKADQARLVNKLAAHLVVALHINSGDLSLVFALSGGSVNNNLAAVKCWLVSNLNDDNIDEDAHYWESKLVKKLSAIVV